MKILFVTNDLHDAVTSRTYFQQWVKSHTEHTVQICSPKGAVGMEKLGDIIFYPERGFSISNYFALQDILTKEKADIVIFRGIELVALSVFLKISGKNVFLLTGLGKVWDPALRSAFLLRPFYKLFLAFAMSVKNARLILQNEQDAEDLNQIDAFILRSSGVKQAAIVPEQSESPLKIVTASRINKAKGIRAIIEFSNAIINNPKYTYDVFGSFDDCSCEMKQEIDRINSESTNVHWHGHTPPDQFNLANYHLAYFPSRYREGSPRFLIESIQMGLVVITGNAPGCELLASNGNGAQVQNVKQAVDFLSKLDTQTLRRMSKKSIQIFAEKFDNHIVYSQLVSFLERLNTSSK